MSLAEGGQEGDSEVTVRVSVAAGGSFAQTEKITFTLPTLRVTPVVIDPVAMTRGVTVDASIEVTTSTGQSFPDMVGFDANEVTDADPVTIYNIVPALYIGWAEAVAEGEVDLMDRKVLTGGSEEMPANLPLGTLTAVTMGNVTVRNLEEEDTDNDPPVELADLAGKLIITATGNFQTDDKVMLGEAELTRSEGGGSFSGEIAITDASGPGIAVTYQPGGVDDLLPATFNATAVVQYDDEENASGAVEGQGTATISYAGISLAAYAHGIVKAGGAATTYLRVACAGATDCSVFASCRDQSGGSHFGELGAVAAGGLEVYDSNEIGEALDGGWETGRGRCDLLSDGVLEVQNMLNQGSANVNNSLVTNGAGILTKTQ